MFYHELDSLLKGEAIRTFFFHEYLWSTKWEWWNSQLNLRLHFTAKQHFPRHPWDSPGSNINRWKLEIGLCSPRGLRLRREKSTYGAMELKGKVTVTDAGLKPHKVFKRTSGLTILSHLLYPTERTRNINVSWVLHGGSSMWQMTGYLAESINIIVKWQVTS